jgi:hypothetical protein
MAQEDTSMQVDAAQAPVPVAPVATVAAAAPQVPGAGAVPAAPAPAQPEPAAAAALLAATAPKETAADDTSPFEINWPALNASAAALEAAVAAFGPAEEAEQKATEDEAERQRLKARIDESIDVFEKCKALPRDIKVKMAGAHMNFMAHFSIGSAHAVTAVAAPVRQCLEAALEQRIVDQDRLISDWNEATAVLKDETKPMHVIMDRLVSSNAQLPSGARQGGADEEEMKRSGARQLT